MNKLLVTQGQSRMRHLAGFSLVEMVIALALGTVIVLGAVGLFITNQRTFQLQQNLTDVQQQGSFVQGFMINDLRNIGYQDPDVTGSAIPAGVLSGGVTVNSKQFLGSQAYEHGDRLTFSFDGTQDCEGSTSATTVRIVETYTLSNGNLICSGSLTAGSGTTLVSGVPVFHVLYGVDRTIDQQPVAESYVLADVINAAWQVVSIKVSYIVEQDSGNPQNVSTGRTYMVLNQSYTDGVAPLNKANQVRRQFTFTVPVRNFDWTRI